MVLILGTTHSIKLLIILCYVNLNYYFYVKSVYGLPSVLNVVAGRCHNFTIVSRDTSRNLLRKGGDNFDVYMYRVNFNSVKAGNSLNI